MEDARNAYVHNNRREVLINSDSFSPDRFKQSLGDLREIEIQEKQTSDEISNDHLIATYWG